MSKPPPPKGGSVNGIQKLVPGMAVTLLIVFIVLAPEYAIGLGRDILALLTFVGGKLWGFLRELLSLAEGDPTPRTDVPISEDASQALRSLATLATLVR